MRDYIIANFDGIILGFFAVYAVIVILLRLSQQNKQSSSSNDEILEYVTNEVKKPEHESDLLMKASKISIYIPFGVIGICAILGAHNVLLQFGLLLSMLVLVVIYFIRNPWVVVFLVVYTNIRSVFLNVFFQSFWLIVAIILPTELSPPSKIIPVLCWIGCVFCIATSFQAVSCKGRNVLYTVPLIPFLVLVLVQSIIMIALWFVGGYQFSKVLRYQYFDWRDWLNSIFFGRSDLFIECVKCIGFILIASVILFMGYTTFRYARNTKEARSVRKIIPLGVLLAGLMIGAGYFYQEPNYLRGLLSPINYEWGHTTGLSARADQYFCMDKEEVLLVNGTPFYLRPELLRYGWTYNVSVTAISDFSTQPYLRYYQETLYDGCVSIWAENQGTVDAVSCEFKLSDEKGELKEHFSKEALRASIEIIPAGGRVCLFTLKNEEMLKPEYEEIPLILEVEAIFCSGIQAWRTTKEIPVDAMLSMRGVTIENAYYPTTEGPLVTLDNPIQWTSALDYSQSSNFIGFFHCDQTMLLEMRIAINHVYGGETELTPIVFIYEVPLI